MKIAITLFALLVLLAGPRAARAHAFLDHAEPAVGAETDQPPREIKVWFTEDLDINYSGLKVVDASGTQVDLKDCRADSKDKKLMTVTVPQLLPGTYRVIWHAETSEDGHDTNGEFKFTVKPAPSTTRSAEAPPKGGG